MQDRHPLLCVLALLLPLAAAVALSCCMGGDMARDAICAALKLVVIR